MNEEEKSVLRSSQTSSTDVGTRYLCFTLGEDKYAMPLLSVKEVIALPEITSVPQTPPYFLGIMNLRGQIISVIDLRLKLGIKPEGQSETAVIICDLRPNSVGIVVDSIERVVQPMDAEISDHPDIDSQKKYTYIQGVYRADNQLILIINISDLLSSEKRSLLQAVKSG